jgi:hypothetical protein
MASTTLMENSSSRSAPGHLAEHPITTLRTARVFIYPSHSPPFPGPL